MRRTGKKKPPDSTPPIVDEVMKWGRSTDNPANVPGKPLVWNPEADTVINESSRKMPPPSPETEDEDSQ